MFGSNGNQMEHMVTKRQWEKINKKLPGANAEAKISLASACSSSTDGEALQVLFNLLKDSDAGVQLQAVKSLGVIGDSSVKPHLQWLMANAGDNKELKDAIGEAMSAINKRG